MLEWFSKLWYEKLFDASLVIVFMGIASFVFKKAIEFLRLSQVNPTVNVNEKGQVTGLSLASSNSGLNPVSTLLFEEIKNNNEDLKKAILELKDINEKKSIENKELSEMVESLKVRLSQLESKIELTNTLNHYKDIRKIPLQQHIVFSTLQTMIFPGITFDAKYEVDTTKKIKIEIAKKFISECKCVVFQKRLLEYIESFKGKTDQEGLTLISNIVQNIGEWVEEYESMAKSLPITLSDGRSIIGVPLCFISKFTAWHAPHVDMVVYKVKDIVRNNFYETWQIKLILILDVIDSAFYLTKRDAEKTIDSLNGGLDSEISLKLNKKEVGW
jgi:hypothetical protein